jgi:hypothetical protein
VGGVSRRKGREQDEADAEDRDDLSEHRKSGRLMFSNHALREAKGARRPPIQRDASDRNDEARIRRDRTERWTVGTVTGHCEYSEFLISATTCVLSSDTSRATISPRGLQGRADVRLRKN